MAFDQTKKSDGGAGPQGTPKTLDEAIQHFLCFRPKKEMSVPDHIYFTLKDFMAQRVSAAMLKAAGKPEIEAAITELWNSLVRR